MLKLQRDVVARSFVSRKSTTIQIGNKTIIMDRYVPITKSKITELLSATVNDPNHISFVSREVLKNDHDEIFWTGLRDYGFSIYYETEDGYVVFRDESTR
jgi:hypothetical protein